MKRLALPALAALVLCGLVGAAPATAAPATAAGATAAGATAAGGDIAAETVDPLKLELARCAGMAHTGKRLACFDALAKRHAPPAALTDNLAVPDNWIVHTTTSKIDDKPSLFLMTEALEPVTTASGAQERPTLVFRCQQNTTELFIIWGQPLGTGSLAVTERVDSDKASTANWTLSTDRSTAFKPSPIPFIRTLLNRHKLLLQLTPEHDNAQTVEFAIEGLERVIEPLQKACGWK